MSRRWGRIPATTSGWWPRMTMRRRSWWMRICRRIRWTRSTATCAIVEDLGMRQPQAATPPADAPELLEGEVRVAPLPPVRIFGCPAHDAVDELALQMFRQLLDPTRIALEVVP